MKTEFSADLLPSLDVVEAAIEANMKERRRLMAIRRLITSYDEPEAEATDDAGTPQDAGDAPVEGQGEHPFEPSHPSVARRARRGPAVP